jgi:predicted nucleic acid-binding protein
MILVLEASAAIDVLLNQGKFVEYKMEIEKADAVIAPELYVSAMANVAWKYRKLAGFSHEESLRFAEDGVNLVDSYIPVADIWKEALREALNNDHPVYDCVYVVCARRNAGILLTNDKRLGHLCDELKVRNI